MDSLGDKTNRHSEGEHLADEEFGAKEAMELDFKKF